MMEKMPCKSLILKYLNGTPLMNINPYKRNFKLHAWETVAVPKLQTEGFYLIAFVKGRPVAGRIALLQILLLVYCQLLPICCPDNPSIIHCTWSIVVGPVSTD